MSPSLVLFCQGYIPAVILGIPMGMLIGMNNVIYQIFKRICHIPATIPSIALLPIALIGFKNNQQAILFLIFFSAIWEIIVNTGTGVQECRRNDNNFRSAIHYIFTGLRMGMRLAWFTLIAAEFLTGSKGIGFFIWDAYNSNMMNEIIKALLYIAIIGFLLDQLLDLAGYLISRQVTDEQKSDM